MSPTLSVTKVLLEVPHDWETTCFATEMHLLDPFFIQRRFPLNPESSRTLIVLFLTFSPELTLGSGFCARSDHVFLLFSFELVQFSSYFFDLDANFYGNRRFLVFREKFLSPREFSSETLALSVFWWEGIPSLDLAFHKLHLFLQEMLITATTSVTLPVFAVLQFHQPLCYH